jgi:hypothetical protein
MLKMKTDKVDVALRLFLEADQSRTVEVKLGAFSLVVNESIPHTVEELMDGKCCMGMPGSTEICKIFCKHKLSKVTKESNPGIFKVLYDVFVNDNEKAFERKKLNSRGKIETTKVQNSSAKEIKLSVKKDENIKKLLADPEFIKLNKATKAECVPSAAAKRRVTSKIMRPAANRQH